MSRLLYIQEQLLDNSAQTTRLEKALAEHPSRALTSSLKSLQKLRVQLEEEFREEAGISQVDVIDYRLFEGRSRPSMSLVGRAMDSFQNLYAILYSAVINQRPKDTSHLSSAAIQQSSFEFSHAYSGSVGFVFTLPNERLLFGETNLDEAMNDLFVMAKASTSEEIRSMARKFGIAPVRAVYEWAKTLCASGVGADIEWRKSESVKTSLVMQPVELEALTNLISLTSDLEIDENQLSGTLLGFDSRSRTFRFEPSDGGLMIRGKLSDTAKLPEPVMIPKNYSAQIRTSTRVRYSTDEPDISHELLSLS